LKVLFLIDALAAGGKERRCVELLKELRHHDGISCDVVVMSRDIHYQEIFDLGLPLHFLLRKTRRDPRIFIKLFRLCKRLQPDIVHTWDGMTSFYAAAISPLLGLKLVNGMVTDAKHHKWYSKVYWMSRITFPISTRVVGNSNAGLQAFHVPPQKGVVIHNGFDFGRIESLQSTEEIRSRFRIQNEYVVGMVASFTERKDYPTFLRAAEQILSKRNDVVFVTVGDGDDLEMMRQMVARNNRNRILFLGKHQSVESIINIFHIGVLATFTEGISNSLMEYMALGKPVVATTGGGTNELVVDGSTGFLVKQQDPLEMAEKIEYLLDNPERARTMGVAGKARIRDEFSIEKMTSNFLTLYDEVMKKH